MIWYLIKRSLLIILFLAAIMIMPIVAWVGVLLMYGAVGISMLIHAVSDSSMDAKGGCITLLLSVAIPIYGITRMNDIMQSEYSELFIVGALCAALIIGGYCFRSLVHSEQNSYSIGSKVDGVTALYPYLLIIAGVMRLVIELALNFFSKYVDKYSDYLKLGKSAGVALFVVALVLYVFRTIYIFNENK